MNAPITTGFINPPLLIDNLGRCLTYLRLAITDRCNLRCRYCMPPEGASFLRHDQILSYEELDRLTSIFVSLGISKIRITGGEPFARKDCVTFMSRIKEKQPGLDLRITTNGVAVQPHLAKLKTIGIGGINLSLDTLDSVRFREITRVGRLDSVLTTFHETIRLGIPLKINSVVQPDTSDAEIMQIAALAQYHPIDVRFIEPMPFSGSTQAFTTLDTCLEERIKRLFPARRKASSIGIETASKFTVAGYRGTIGLIEGESRKFCGSCNKVRVTPAGMMKNCLYDEGVLDLRELLRSNMTDQEIADNIRQTVSCKMEDGYQAAAKRHAEHHYSMASIGG
ncbi:GTP 3',8-cyclase MoaA [Desulforhopalus singaporensis]|uniref:GTP 3',8-cyclase n=1 Tax=Desulforhopalus singaporensis TaxID=91360 RepID=A0A1H0IVU2_9BACT|nr:GTP 3',8-cyclase MoaA [Desulforhopalus singaporensis]SDO35545.1 cyclic pyranopterin phosphate synthase [Desulforhopalus singaporensis]